MNFRVPAIRSILNALSIMVLVATAAVGQDDAGIVSKVEALRFSPLTRQARIQGDVRLHFGSEGITLLSGQPLLAEVAIGNLRELGKLSDGEGEVVYHFVLVSDSNTRVTRTTVKKGPAIKRLILHALKMKTEKVVEYRECIENPTKNRIDLTHDIREVWIYASVACVQAMPSQVASR
jgi:hypothetical protein